MPLLANLHTDAGGTDVAVIFGLDVSSYQGSVDWKKAWNAGIRFGFSKVTQSTNYLNPTWHHNLAGMTSLGSGFVPGAYHFLTAGNGAGQARYFVQAVGGASKCRQLAIALDVEPTTGSSPSIADAKAWVSEFRALVPGHPVIGYVPGWYHSEIGHPSLTFLDVIWQSNYVTGSGSPSALYAKAGQARWAGYGGRSVSILQFSSSGRVSGVSGDCDVNAYRGTAAQLRALTIGGTTPPAPKPEDDMGTFLNIDRSPAAAVIHCPAGKETWLKFDRQWHPAAKDNERGGDWAVIVGDSSHAYWMHGTVYVHLSAAVSCLVRTVQVDDAKYVITEGNPTVRFASDQFEFGVAAGVAKNHHRYVGITPASDVDVTYCAFTGFYQQQ